MGWFHCQVSITRINRGEMQVVYELDFKHIDFASCSRDIDLLGTILAYSSLTFVPTGAGEGCNASSFSCD